MNRSLAILFFMNVAFLGSDLGATAVHQGPCVGDPIWDYLDCASRQDGSSGRFVALQDEIATLCRRGDRETQISVRNWLETNADRYDPAVAASLIGTFHRHRSHNFPDDFMEYQLGRQLFRQLPHELRITHYKEAFREGRVDFDSGYILWRDDAIRDIAEEGLRVLAPLLNTHPKDDLSRRVAAWYLRFRAGAASRSDARQRHLRALSELQADEVASLLSSDEAFGISLSQFRDDLCNPVRYPACESFRSLLKAWESAFSASAVQSARLGAGTHSNDPLPKVLHEMLAVGSHPDLCCDPAKQPPKSTSAQRPNPGMQRTRYARR